MCSCDPPAAFNQTIRTARTFKRCCECRGWIKRGDRYEYSSGVWDGQGASFNTCLACRSLRQIAHEDMGCGPCFTELFEWAEEAGMWRRTWDLEPDQQWREFRSLA